MADYGFSISSSCSGFEWYKKTIKRKGQDAFITITGNEDSGLPESLDDPILAELTVFTAIDLLLLLMKMFLYF